MNIEKVARFKPASNKIDVVVLFNAFARARREYITEYRKGWSMMGNRATLRRWALHFGRQVRMMGVPK